MIASAKRHVCALFLLFAGCREQPTTTSPPNVATPSRPNVLLISLDTVRPDHLGCYGYDRPTTPNLDRFAEQCVRFTNCRAQATWTLPSHMSLLTSMLPSTNGVDNLNKVLPAEFVTLAELLRDDGYRTTALVNNGQMRAHWGFDRGFGTWREFAVDTPEGNCEQITAAATEWLASANGPQPWFLFLHYYDTHDPYDAPPEFRRRFGTSLNGDAARELCFRFRTPERNLDFAQRADLMAAYDAELAWLDRELGKLLAAVPENTLVVIFSDHGEAFEEHGWTLHGATLYEEEVRVPLLIRLPRAQTATVNDSVMLLDVAPTIASQCRTRIPAQFQGLDLGPSWAGQSLPSRLVPAESKAVLEGRLSLSVVVHPLKAIYQPLDGRLELFRLPNELESLTQRDHAAAEALAAPLRRWFEQESFWRLHAAGDGEFEATIELRTGRFGLYIPVELHPERDEFEVSADGRRIRWRTHPRGDRIPSLFLQPVPADVPLVIDLRWNGESRPDAVFLGPQATSPAELPAEASASVPPVSPVIDRPFSTTKPGLHVFRHRSESSREPPADARALDAETIRQLRSLGYLQ